MFGWINESTERLVVCKFGIDKWHEIKKKAGCTVADGGFVRHRYYSDESTVKIVVAASEVLGIPVDGVLEAYGAFFMEFTRQEGYENLLDCQGSTLRLWLSNLNALHDHLESSLPPGFVAPVFWCEDDEDVRGSILLHYFSKRGSLLAPLVVGIVKEVARHHFSLEITMERLATQGEDDSKCTSWRISAVNEEEQVKLTRGEEEDHVVDTPPAAATCTASSPDTQGSACPFEDEKEAIAKALDSPAAPQCPFSSMMAKVRMSQEERQKAQEIVEDEKKEAIEDERRKGWQTQNECGRSEEEADEDHEQEATTAHEKLEEKEHSQPPPPAATGKPKESPPASPSISLSSDNMQKVFPYHVVVDENFGVLQVGKDFPSLIRQTGLVGRHLETLLKIVRPPHCGWDWRTLHKLEDQTFFMESLDGDERIKMKGNMVIISQSPKQVMFVLSPDAKNIQELREMNLTMSDLPLHSFQRDAVFLGEHIASEVRSAHVLNKLSKKLDREMKLSNMLLYQMLPRKVAHDLRAGKQVDPEHHENVTIFFSDIVGFTDICSCLEPPDVIVMLNRLYIVMDYVAEKFGLYKVETIGDAYMVCSGLPYPDPNHSHKVAMFALVVREAIKHVLSPLDNSPIKLRIGIHTGSCMAGVVGNLMPRYCLFGDTVNTAARHESTGEAGKIHCSSTTYADLTRYECREHDCNPYKLNRRGVVDMKGKGEMVTYWLDSVDPNCVVCAVGMTVEEMVNVAGLLLLNTAGPRRYFNRRGSVIDATVA